MKFLFRQFSYIFTTILFLIFAFNTNAEEKASLRMPSYGYSYYDNSNSADNNSVDTSLIKMKYPSRFYSKTSRAFDRFASSKFLEISMVGIPMIIIGSITKVEDNRFHAYANNYSSVFHNRFDDYIQYVPAAVMLGMKLGGVKGRSSWGRMIASDAFSAALVGGSVMLLKNTMDTRRPDGSSNNSFPSGHTAVAFMTATMLQKEFGHISPWISVGAYSLAVATGIGRQLNSRHWLSDLMVGAAIGVVSTELGYFFADLIFKDKGLKRKAIIPMWDYGRKPSFFGLYAGVNLILGGYYLPTGELIETKGGNSVGYEGAWFPHKNVGLGARFILSNNLLAVNKEVLEGWLGMLSPYAGAYYSVPLSMRWSWDGKSLL
ncbi:MAG: phosphatase PAP2 family protein, partial [Bacteroidales bacterium]